MIINFVTDLLQQTKEICGRNNIIPTRSKGQNFLIEETVYAKIIEAADLSKDDTVLEVGPGFGFLTRKLAAKAGRVIAVELDDKLAGLLEANLQQRGIENVEVLNENVLDLNPKSLIPNPKSQNIKIKKKLNFESRELNDYKIVANLPYNISSIFLRKFLTVKERPSEMVLMLQKEVAERIVAKPGKMSLLAVSVQFYAQASVVCFVPANAFWPAPKVDSAIIRLKIKNCKSKILGGVDKERDFFRLVRFGFAAKRKMLKNNLVAGYKINQENAENYLKLANLSPKIRAEDLSVADWIKLFELVG